MPSREQALCQGHKWTLMQEGNELCGTHTQEESFAVGLPQAAIILTSSKAQGAKVGDSSYR